MTADEVSVNKALDLMEQAGVRVMLLVMFQTEFAVFAQAALQKGMLGPKYT